MAIFVELGLSFRPPNGPSCNSPTNVALWHLQSVNKTLESQALMLFGTRMSNSRLILSLLFRFILIIQLLSRVSAIRYEYSLSILFGSSENLEKQEFFFSDSDVSCCLVYWVFVTGTAYLSESEKLIRNV